MSFYIKVQETKGAVVYSPETAELAAMHFSLASADKLIIDHTEVDDSLRGQGIGKKLLEVLVAYLRENEMKAIPLCPFARAAFEKDTSIHDVLFT